MLVKVTIVSAFVICVLIHATSQVYLPSDIRITEVQDYPPCYKEGLTWGSESIDALPAIESAFACQAACVNTPNCSGFTWYDLSSPVIPKVCNLYDTINEETPCTSCVSGPASCTCSSEFACVVSGTNLLDIIVHVRSEMECLMECAAMSDCSIYTWYDQASLTLTNECFLFSSCEEVDLATEGSHSGPVECGSSTTPTTAEPTTSSEVATTTQSGTTGAVSCEVPENPSNGTFDCFSTDSYLVCDLLCDPGYATGYRSRTQCHGGSWSFLPVTMVCETTVLLVTGGDMEQARAELYSTDGSNSCSLSNLLIVSTTTQYNMLMVMSL